MKRKSAISLAVVLILTIFAGIVTIHGLPLPANYRYKSVSQAMKLGLDLRGGAYAVFHAANSSGNGYDRLMDQSVTVISRRLSLRGFSAATVTRQGKNNIRVEIPDAVNPSDLLEFLGTGANLEIIDPEGTVIATGADLTAATAGGTEANAFTVDLTLGEIARENFATSTEKFVGQPYRVTLDGAEIAAPTFEAQVTDGRVQVGGIADKAEAQRIVLLLRSGALPVALSRADYDARSATLGEQALSRGVLAGVISLILIMLFMILVYRLPGLVASAALAIYAILYIFFICSMSIEVTMPGIAGIIVSLGMAVDANIIVFERMREEIKGGRGLLPSMRLGFRNAFSAIFDSNITTIIASLVLLAFGTGPISSFAVTLMLGVVVSMFTTMVVSRFLLRQVIGLGIQNTKLYAR